MYVYLLYTHLKFFYVFLFNFTGFFASAAYSSYLSPHLLPEKKNMRTGMKKTEENKYGKVTTHWAEGLLFAIAGRWKESGSIAEENRGGRKRKKTSERFRCLSLRDYHSFTIFSPPPPIQRQYIWSWPGLSFSFFSCLLHFLWCIFILL